MPKAKAKKENLEDLVETEEVKDATQEAGEQTAEQTVPKVDIIRGRMPLPIVAMIKQESSEMTDGTLAMKYRTTNGKISDIRKNRNFGYVTSDYTPSADQIEKAKVFAGQLKDKTVLEAVEAMVPATDEQNAAFDEIRKASRPGRKKKDVTTEAPVDPVAKPSAESAEDDLSSLTE